jgi:hypothetical protein
MHSFYYLNTNEIDNSKLVIISDIDTPKSTPYIVNDIPKILKFMKDNKTMFHSRTFTCSLSNVRFNSLLDEEVDKYKTIIPAGSIISKIKFDIKYLNELFYCIENILSKKLKSIRSSKSNKSKNCLFINRFINKQKLYDSYRIVNTYSKFVYGIDEIFLLKYIKEYLIDNNISYSYSLEHNKDLYIYRILETWRERKTNYFKNNKKYLPLWKEILGNKFIEGSSNDNYFKAIKLIKNKNKTIQNAIENLFIRLLKTKEYKYYNLRLRDIKCIIEGKDIKDEYFMFKVI